MEALANLRDHCPDWAKRLDELSGQVEQRQLDLAELAAQQQRSPRCLDGRTRSKSVRNHGSTESLRPNDDGGALPGPDIPARSGMENHKSAAQEARRASVASRGGVDKLQDHSREGRGNSNGNSNSNSNSNGNGNSNGPNSSSPPTSERQTNQVVAVASAKARATLRRTQLSKRRAAAAADSLLSADGVTPGKYRSRSLVIVYYDSYVQSFFEELVKFVSASKHLMRKARMAAKVAHIKRMAELEMPDDDSDLSGEALPWDGNGTMRVVPPRSAPKALRPESGGNGQFTDHGDGDKPESEPPTSGAKSYAGNGNGYSPVSSPAVQPFARPGIGIASNSNGNSNDNSNGNSNGNGNGHKPSSPTSSPTRPKVAGRFSSFSNLGFGSQKLDVFDELDKALECVQSMCEHAAHQFLRDGDCADEIVKIKDRLDETKEAADKEMERLLVQSDANDESITKVKEQPAKIRTYRQPSIRKTAVGPGPPTSASEKPVAEQVERLFAGSSGALEIDEGACNNDEAIEPRRYQYRSTRAMGPWRTAP